TTLFRSVDVPSSLALHCIVLALPLPQMPHSSWHERVGSPLSLHSLPGTLVHTREWFPASRIEAHLRLVQSVAADCCRGVTLLHPTHPTLRRLPPRRPLPPP